MGTRIKKGDIVEVIYGNDRGIRDEVLRVLRDSDGVVVSGAHIVKKHQRPMQAGRGQVQAGIIDFEAPIHISNVMLVCPHCHERTRVGFARLDDGRKVRVCKKCDEFID